MGWFSNFFGGSTKKEPSSSSGSSNSTENNYLEASGIGSQIANDQIDNLINNNQDLKNKAGNVVINSKFDNIMKCETNPNKMNSAQKALYDFYNTGTNAYQQEMQKIINSNPSAAKAYKERFPITSAIKNIGGTASNLIPGVGMAKGILKVLGNFGKGTKNVFNQAVTGITDSNAYNDFKNLVTKDEKLPTDMGTRMSSMDQADADAATLNMADISGPSMSTDIIEIKDKKVKTKNNLDKINNAQKTLNEALDIQNFRRILDNPSAIETLPINFKSTVDTLLQNNQLNSGDYLKSQQLLRDKGTPVGPFINGYNNAGIINALPNNNQVATNLFNNFTPTLESISNFNESLSDGKGFDVNLKDQTFEYNKPMLGGNLNFGIDNSSNSPTFGINFSKSLG
jgi:hypothetical protein